MTTRPKRCVQTVPFRLLAMSKYWNLYVLGRLSGSQPLQVPHRGAFQQKCHDALAFTLWGSDLSRSHHILPATRACRAGDLRSLTLLWQGRPNGRRLAYYICM